jgi:hypothetical protein
VVGYEQGFLKIINLCIDLVTLSLEFQECASWFWKVQEVTDVIVGQGSLETIHELNIKPVSTRSPSVELQFQRCKRPFALT